jgi:hypothetical protein
MRTVTSPYTKHTSRDATYATLQHTKQTIKLLLRARVPANAAQLSVYTQQWCIHKERQCTSMGRGGERRQERYSETVLSEEHYSGGYLYVV